MALHGNPLTFDEAEISELLELRYNAKKTFAVLALLYPGLDLSKTFHEDHIFPKSLFTRKNLRAMGLSAGQIDDYLNTFDLLPNLQLLAGTANIEKRATLPKDWIASAFPTDERRRTYLDENDLSGLPLDVNDFLEFCVQRKARMRQRLVKALGGVAVAAATDR